MKNKIGFWGYPPPDVIQRIKKEYPKAQWFDLDFDFSDKVPDANILPESYCKIIKQIINNSLYFKNELIKIVAPVGKDKCDSGWFAAQLLKDMGFDVEETKFETFEHRSPVVISTSNMPLYDKITTITANIVADSINNSNIVQCKPNFGFWGVPPNDLEVLRLFPNALNGNPNISEKTRIKVLAKANEMDYKQNKLALALKSGKS
ncbi:helix-turn-helix domain-containing protein, partial [bacterium]|nr:helix-turn-helix domain-containing protein [bacterium]